MMSYFIVLVLSSNLVSCTQPQLSEIDELVEVINDKNKMITEIKESKEEAMRCAHKSRKNLISNKQVIGVERTACNNSTPKGYADFKSAKT